MNTETIDQELQNEEAIPVEVDTEGEVLTANQGLLTRDEKFAQVVANHESQPIEFDHSVEGHRDDAGEPVPVQLPPGVVQRDGEWFQELVIDGETVTQPYNQYLQQAQKFTAGDKRLREGVDFQKGLNTQKAELDEWQLRLENQQATLSASATPENDPSATDDSSRNFDEEAVPVVDGLFSGDRDDAISAVSELIKLSAQNGAPPVDADELATNAANRALEHIDQRSLQGQEALAKRNMQEAYSSFAEAYPNLVADDALFEKADLETELVAAEHPHWSVNDIMLEAGKRVTAQTGGDITTNVSDNSGRLANKANLQPIPTIHSSAVPAAPSEAPTVDNSPAGVISRMRAGRGARPI